jgi:hypothetical protein
LGRVNFTFYLYLYQLRPWMYIAGYRYNQLSWSRRCSRQILQKGSWSSHDGSRQYIDAVRELRNILVNTTDDVLALRNSFKKCVRFSTRCDRLANWCYQKRACKGLHLMATHPLRLFPVADLELRHSERCETAMVPEGKWVDVNCSDILGMEHASAIDLAIYAKCKGSLQWHTLFRLSCFVVKVWFCGFGTTTLYQY